MDPLVIVIILTFILVLVLLVRNISQSHKENTFMASAQQALADLQAAAATISNQLANLQTIDGQLQSAIDKLVAAQQAGGVQPADIEAVVASLQSAQTALGSITNSVQSQLQEATGQPAAQPPATGAAGAATPVANQAKSS